MDELATEDAVIPPHAPKLEQHAQKAVDAGAKYRGSLVVLTWMVALVILGLMATIGVVVLQGPQRSHDTQHLIKSTQTQVDTLSTQVTDLKMQVTALKTDITSLNDEITTITNLIGARQAAANKIITQLQTLLSQQNQKIAQLNALLKQALANHTASTSTSTPPATSHDHGHGKNKGKPPHHISAIVAPKCAPIPLICLPPLR